MNHAPSFMILFRSGGSMIRKILWMLILLIMTACTILYSDGGDIFIDDPTPTSTGCEDCTLEPTSAPTEDVTPDVEPTATEISVTVAPTSTALPTQTLSVTSTLVPTSTKTAVPPTATHTQIPPTATKTVLPPTPTKTAIPPTSTSTAIPPTSTSTAISEIYVVQPATPVFLDNFVHTTEGCAWQGVAGQVFDAAGKPVTNLIIKISGIWNDAGVSLVGVTGMVSGLPYGPGSYEIILGNKALNTVDQLQIQVFKADQTPLTVPLTFSTSADCTKNLVMINFKAK